MCLDPLARFFNMKKSQRGSIRKAPSAISWVVSLRNTFAGNKSLDPAGIIKQWILGAQLIVIFFA